MKDNIIIGLKHMIKILDSISFHQTPETHLDYEIYDCLLLDNGNVLTLRNNLLTINFLI